MAEGPTIFRLSLLAFDDAALLWRALADLIDRKLTSEQLCLVGLAASLARLDMPGDAIAPHRDEMRRLLSAGDGALALAGGDSLTARCGTAMRDLLGTSGRAAGAFPWMQQGASEKIAAQATRGAIILLASAFDAEQHSTIARVLLGHARSNLQTHEFTRPSSSAEPRPPQGN